MTTAARAAATSPFRLITLSSSCVWLPAQALEALLRHVGATVAVFRKDATTRALPGEGRRGPGLFSGPNSYAPLSGRGARFREKAWAPLLRDLRARGWISVEDFALWRSRPVGSALRWV